MYLQDKLLRKVICDALHGFSWGFNEGQNDSVFLQGTILWSVAYHSLHDPNWFSQEG